jgi:hypothetical protein
MEEQYFGHCRERYRGFGESRCLGEKSR